MWKGLKGEGSADGVRTSMQRLEIRSASNELV
jgi:hypothetical protein